MNLMTIRGMIRKTSGNPSIVVDAGNGVPMTLALQKTPFLEELGRVFDNERTAETGLSFDPSNNMLTVDGYVGGRSAGELVDEDEPMSPEELTDLDDEDDDDLL